MLEGLFEIERVEDLGTKHIYHVKVNPSHVVFDGHFPNQPVLPGVAMVYLSRLLTQMQLAIPVLNMKSASQIKFLSLVDPRENAAFTYVNEIVKQEGEEVTVKGDLKHEETTFFKINATYNS